MSFPSKKSKNDPSALPSMPEQNHKHGTPSYPQNRGNKPSTGNTQTSLCSQRMGQFAEDVVSFWYEQAGYTILYRNYRCLRGEVDMIAQHGGVLAFVEVRGLARTEDPRHAIASVHNKKQQRLQYTISHYLQQQSEPFLSEVSDIVLEVVGVTMNRQGDLHLYKVCYEP